MVRDFPFACFLVISLESLRLSRTVISAFPSLSLICTERETLISEKYGNDLAIRFSMLSFRYISRSFKQNALSPSTWIR